MNITEPLRHIARITPDAVAIVRGDGSTISYAMLERAVDRMAMHAIRLGLRPGDIAGHAITGPDESLGYILALALARIGVAMADPSLPPERLRLSFQAAREGASVSPGKVRYDAGWTAGGKEDPVVAIHPDPAALCIVFTTSGSTGLPKHVPISHALMERRVQVLMVGTACAPAVRILGVGLSGAMGYIGALRTRWTGGTIVLTNPKEAAAAITRHGVTSIAASPSALRAMLEALPQGQSPFPSLVSIEVAGGLLPAPLRRLLAERVCQKIITFLGASEAGAIAAAPVDVVASRAGAVGFVLPGVQVQAVDATEQPLPAGLPGVLRVRGQAVASGYLWDEAASADSFRDGWFYSGDVGAVWPDGMVTLSGRASEVINSGGTKISPHVIEEVFLALPGIIDAAAFGVPDLTGIEQIWVAIVPRARIDDAVLNSFRQHALRGMTPTTILQLKALPRDENGKLMREQLIRLAMGVREASTGA